MSLRLVLVGAWLALLSVHAERRTARPRRAPAPREPASAWRRAGRGVGLLAPVVVPSAVVLGTWQAVGMGRRSESGSSRTGKKVYATRGGEAFEKIDLNRDGRLNRAEYLKVAELGARMSSFEPEVTASVLALFYRLFEICDIDEDRHLSEVEYDYAGYLLKIAEYNNLYTATDDFIPSSSPGHEFDLNRVAGALPAIDLNGDEMVDEGEFHKALEAFSEKASEWGMSVEDSGLRANWANRFRTADMDGDGVLGLREFQYAGFLIKHNVIDKVADIVFEDVDSNMDGECDVEEMFRPPKADESPFTQVVRERFAQADSNKDEQLQRCEVDSLLGSVIASIMDTSLF